VSDVEKWGDSQQYRAEPHGSYAGPEQGVMPQVTLLWMTPDPLGAIGAMCAMYEGRVVRDLSELDHSDRVRYWEDVRKTHLDTPLEAVTFQFLLEGVDRSFTHQLVRKRVGAAYAQESLRFAVPGSLNEATTLPPSLQGTMSLDTPGAVTAMPDQKQAWRNLWDQAVGNLDATYQSLVSSGMPAEEARGLLPHATATRVVWLTNLRSLLQEAGNRLCTQAQFHWRLVFMKIISEIAAYPHRLPAMPDVPRLSPSLEKQREYDQKYRERHECFERIAQAFRPVCYEHGRCPFKAGFDRDCSIRQRVDYFAKRGVPSSEWGEDYEEPTNINDPLPWARGPAHPGADRDTQVDVIPAIHPREWLLNPAAARRRTTD
jgi:flavin-dependent thymidylate synthase